MKRFLPYVLVFSVMAAAAQAADYVPGELYVKYANPGTAKPGQDSPEQAIIDLGGVNIRQAFPVAAMDGARKMNAVQQEQLDSVASIHRVSFPENFDMELIARKLSENPSIEYAEPVWIDSLLFSPNDPVFGNKILNADQEYLRYINAPNAWNLSRGDSTVVIGIVDAGVDWHHPDLAAHVWTNPGEIPGNGIDDDGNGYKDDVHGWDFFDSDNDPVPESQPHGTHVAGIAAAVTDNNIGIASLSYNVRFMPVQAGSGKDGEISYGYEGILYAAMNGARIINCSWGANHFSRAAQDVVQTAQGLGALIVAAAGNNNNAVSFYPAGYPGVIGVGSVSLNGSKSAFSNYGTVIDVCAPGENIFSTILNNDYGYMTGTSMAAPVVSALAALVIARHPDWDADYIQAQIMGTARPFATTATYLLGAGIIDAEQALGTPVFHLNIVSSTFSDAGGDADGMFRPGEELDARIDIRNTGQPGSRFVMTVRSLTGFTVPLIQSIDIGSLAHGQTVIVDNLKFQIQGGIPQNAKEIIRFDFHDQNDGTSFTTLDVPLNPSYTTFTENTVELSFSDTGNLGFVDFPTNETGSSFIIHGQPEGDVFETPLLFEGGLLYGTGPTAVSNVVRGDSPETPDHDIISSGLVKLEKSPDGSSQTGTASFTDGTSVTGVSQVSTEFTGTSFGNTALDQSVILSYEFHNTGSNDIPAMRAGLFLDFDIPDSSPSDDQAFYVGQDDIMVIAEDSSTRPDRVMAGVTALESIDSPWLIQNAYIPQAGDPIFGIYDGFTDKEKWQALSGGTTGSATISGTDVSMVVSPPPFALHAGGKQRRTFILAWGIGYDDLRKQIQQAKAKARELFPVTVGVEQAALPEVFGIESIYPNPFNPSTTISISVPRVMQGELIVYSITGQRIATLLDGLITAGSHQITWNGMDDRGMPVSSGIYLVSLQSEQNREVRRITLVK